VYALTSGISPEENHHRWDINEVFRDNDGGSHVHFEERIV
jgi:hypothetical protein